MTESEKEDTRWLYRFCAYCGLAFLLVVAIIATGKYYHAKLQAEQFHKEGIEIDTWGVFLGVKPAKTIHQIQ